MQNNSQINAVTVELLREYCVFARLSNFSAAAKQLFVSQPTLSNHMKRLEDLLGFPLIVHGNKPELTPGGKAFLQTAETMLQLFDNAIALDVRLGSQGSSLIVEEPSNTEKLAEATAIVFAQFAESRPLAALSLRSVVGSTSLEALRSTKIDIAKIVDINAPDSEEHLSFCKKMGIRTVSIAHEIPYVWMDPSNKLATKASISPEDIAEFGVICQADPRYEGWRRLIMGIAQKAGKEAMLVSQPEETLTGFYMAPLNGRIYIMPESLESGRMLLRARGLTAIPMDADSCNYYVYLCCLADSENPLAIPYMEAVANAIGSIR